MTSEGGEGEAVRKIILSMYVSLDGVMEDPAWTRPFWGDDLAAFARDQLFAADALLLGRVTYQGFAAAWPAIADAQGFADRMNALPKFVASTTLEAPAWNASVLGPDVLAEVARLKETPGRDLLIYGSAGLVASLLPRGLIDEYRFWVHPVLVGAGRRAFPEGASATLLLVETIRFASGVVILTYRPGAPA